MTLLTKSISDRLKAVQAATARGSIPWWVLSCIALMAGGSITGTLPPALLLLPVLILASWGVIRRCAMPGARRPDRAFVILVVISVALATIRLSVPPGLLPSGLALNRLSIVLIGWTLVLWLPLRDPGTAPPADAWTPRGRHIAVLLTGSLAVAAMVHARVVGDFAVLQDEVLYLLQSRWMTQAQYGWKLDPELLQFFRPEYTSYRAGTLTTQYAPGWPTILALFSAAGLRWWSTPLLVVATIGFTYLLGRELHSTTAGFLAALVVAFQKWVIESAQGYMSHAASMAAVAAAAFLLIRGEAAEGRSRYLSWTAAGLALGTTVAIRPLSGAAMTVSLLLWLLARRRLRLPAVLMLSASLAAGALLPIAATLHHNATANGDPFLFGYQAVHGELHSLGFGERGYQYYQGDIEPVVIAAEPFTPRIAIGHLSQRLWDFASGGLPLGLLLPVLWLGISQGFMPAWKSLASFLALPAAYFLYFFTNIRFYSELIPVLAAGIGVLLVHVAQRGKRAVTFLIAVIVAANLAVAAIADTRHRRAGDVILPNVARLREAAARHGKIIVFVRENPEAHLFRRLSLFNEHGLTGEILVARDRGPANEVLIRRLPDHVPLIGTWEEGRQEIELRALR